MDQACCTVADWHASLRARSTNKAASYPGSHGLGIAAFDDTPPEVVQPSLTDDVLCLHRGGAKRVHRIRDGRRETFDVAPDALTFLHRGRPALWVTEGPIDYVHLTISANVLDDVAGNAKGPAQLDAAFADTVGFADPLISNLMIELFRVCGEGAEGRLYQEALLTSLVLALVRRSSTSRYDRAVGATASGIKGGLAGWRLRAVIDYLDANRRRGIALDELVRVSGLSRAHFYRAFLQSTGLSPGRYVERLRVDDARQAIERGVGLKETAEAVGFPNHAAMTRAFRRTLMVTPDIYRRCVR